MRRAGFVLVGGRSARMGRDKALLPWGSGLLIQHVVEQIAVIVNGNVALVGAPERYADVDFSPRFPARLSDTRPGLGPVGGIEAALESGRGDLNLIVSCDTPAVDDRWSERLFQVAENSGSACVITRDQSGRVHPLWGIYRSDCLPVVRRNIQSSRLRAMDLVGDLSAITITMPGILPNLNTPEEWTEFTSAQVVCLRLA